MQSSNRSRGRLARLAPLALTGVLAAGLLAPAVLAPAAAATDLPATDLPATDLPALGAAVDPGGHLQRFSLPDTNGLPSDIEGDGGSGVWVSAFASRQLLHLDSAGVVIMVAELTGSPSSVATDNEGGAWATLYASNKVAHVGADGTVTEYASPTPNSFPARVYDHGDFVFFTESNSGRLGRITQATGVVTDFLLPGAVTPWALDGISDPKQSRDVIWVTDSGLGALWLVDPSGAVIYSTTRVPRLSEVGLLRNPIRPGVVAFGADDEHAYDIGEGFGVGDRTSNPGVISGLAVDGDQAFIVDSARKVINAIQRDVEVSIPMPNDSLKGVAVTESGRYIWTVDQRSGTVVKLESLVTAKVARIGGADRFSVAANVSKQVKFPLDSRTVFITSGENFADALSVGPLAARITGSVLLTKRDELPAVIREELTSMKPARIVIVGGIASVSQSVVEQARAGVPTAEIIRIGGADRFEVSRTILASTLQPTAPQVLYVADGRNFADALSSGPAAAQEKGGVLLIDGSRTGLTGDEEQVIRAIAARKGKVTIVGGPASIGDALEAQIASIVATTRVSGADRFEVSANLNRAIFPEARHITLASGATFPDALAGGALAGSGGRPLYLARTDCVPSAMIDFLATKSIKSVTLFGGERTLNPAVAALTACG